MLSIRVISSTTPLSAVEVLPLSESFIGGPIFEITVPPGAVDRENTVNFIQHFVKQGIFQEWQCRASG